MDKLIRKYRNKDLYDLSCSESILYAANEYYSLNLKEESFHMMAPFSGGLFEGDLCGIVSGCISVLGIVFTNNVAHQSSFLKAAVIDFKKQFKESYKSLDCSYIYENYYDEDSGCNDSIEKGALILMSVITKYKKLQEDMYKSFTINS